MWGISYPNLQMMLADAVAVLMPPPEDYAAPAQGRMTMQQQGERHTTPPMSFGAFLKTMHDIQDHKR